LPLPADADRENPHHLRRRRAMPARNTPRNTPTTISAPASAQRADGGGPSVARLVKANEKTGRDCGALMLTMIIADETDEAAMAKWEHYKAGTDPRGAGLPRRAGGGRSEHRHLCAAEPAAHSGDEQAADQPGRAGRFLRLVARMLDELATVPGRAGVMMTFDDFVIGMEQFGTRIMPLMRCRER
jgi:pyrimidine oxygenase